jgi:nitrogen-specific signal transduction histidine kinase
MENQILIALKNNKLLKNILFDDLDVSKLKGDLLTISEGEILFREGNDSEFLYLVVSGEINVLRKREGIKASSLIFNDHDFLGCEEFIESSKRKSTAVALRDSYIIALTKSEVDNLIDQNDEILHNIYEAINSNDFDEAPPEESRFNDQVDFKSSDTDIPTSNNSFASKVFQSTGPQLDEFNKEDSSSEQLPNDEVLDTNFTNIEPENSNAQSSEIDSEELDIFPDPAEESASESIDTIKVNTENNLEVTDDIEIAENNFNNSSVEDELKESLNIHDDKVDTDIAGETNALIDQYEEEFETSGNDENIAGTENISKYNLIEENDQDSIDNKSTVPDENEITGSVDKVVEQKFEDAIELSPVVEDLEENTFTPSESDLKVTESNDSTSITEEDKIDVSGFVPNESQFTQDKESENVKEDLIPETENESVADDNIVDDLNEAQSIGKENYDENELNPIESLQPSDSQFSEDINKQIEEQDIIPDSFEDSSSMQEMNEFSDKSEETEVKDDVDESIDPTINFVTNESPFSQDHVTGHDDSNLESEINEEATFYKEEDDSVKFYDESQKEKSEEKDSTADFIPNESQLSQPTDEAINEVTGEDDYHPESDINAPENTSMVEESNIDSSDIKPEDKLVDEVGTPDDIFNNYSELESLEPLIPSSYKVDFKDRESKEISEPLPDADQSSEEDNLTIQTEETKPEVNDADFNFDERFGKIDPFYDAKREEDSDEINEQIIKNTDEQIVEPAETIIEKDLSQEVDNEPAEDDIPKEIQPEEITSEDIIENTSPEINISNESIIDEVVEDSVENESQPDPKEVPQEVPKFNSEILMTSSVNSNDNSVKNECEQTVELLEKINRAAELVNSDIKIDDVLKNIVDSAVDLTHADRGTLYIVDKAKNELWSKIAMGDEFKEIKLNIGEGIAGWVAQSGEVINLDKVQSDPRFNTSFDKLSGYVTNSMLCFPIKDKEKEVVGVVQLLNSKNGSFTKLDEEFLESLSIHAAMALQNAALVEKLLTSERVSSLGKMANFLIQDIKKPIMVSKRYAEHLKSKSLDDDVSKVVEMLLDQLNQIADLVQSTSSYSEGQIVLRSVVTKLNETLDDFLNRMDSFVRSFNCQITKDYDNELSVKVSEKQFYQAIQSIIKNACQAMPEGGNILLKTEKADDRVIIRIKDQGLGIPDSLHDKIFEPFMTHGKREATGLGLSIAKKIIEEHGGKISLTSNVGEGTTFIIELPVVYAV